METARRCYPPFVLSNLPRIPNLPSRSTRMRLRCNAPVSVPQSASRGRCGLRACDAPSPSAVAGGDAAAKATREPYLMGKPDGDHGLKARCLSTHPKGRPCQVFRATRLHLALVLNTRLSAMLRRSYFLIRPSSLLFVPPTLSLGLFPCSHE